MGGGRCPDALLALWSGDLLTLLSEISAFQKKKKKKKAPSHLAASLPAPQRANISVLLVRAVTLPHHLSWLLLLSSESYPYFVRVGRDFGGHRIYPPRCADL